MKLTPITKTNKQTKKHKGKKNPHLLQKSFDGLGSHLSTGYGLVDEQAHGQRDEELPCILLQDVLERCGTLIIIMKGIMYSLHTSARRPGKVWNINNHHEGDCVRCLVFILLQDVLERCGTLIIIMKGIVYDA